MYTLVELIDAMCIIMMLIGVLIALCSAGLCMEIMYRDPKDDPRETLVALKVQTKRILWVILAFLIVFIATCILHGIAPPTA